MVTCNASGGRIWNCAPDTLIGEKIDALLEEGSAWIVDKIAEVRAAGKSEIYPDATVTLRGVAKSVNLTIMPLLPDANAKEVGSMLMFEDISTEKRMMSTMSPPPLSVRSVPGNLHQGIVRLCPLTYIAGPGAA